MLNQRCGFKLPNLRFVLNLKIWRIFICRKRHFCAKTKKLKSDHFHHFIFFDNRLIFAGNKFSRVQGAIQREGETDRDRRERGKQGMRDRQTVTSRFLKSTLHNFIVLFPGGSFFIKCLIIKKCSQKKNRLKGNVTFIWEWLT
jgi:hypothetical protein